MIQKQGLNVNFAQGLDTKTDPNQVQMGRLLSLENAVFNKGGLLQKRNGFANVTQLPVSNLSTLTTLNDNLTAIGDSLYAFSADTNQWLNRGQMPNVDLTVQAIARSTHNEINNDAVVDSSGLTCVTFLDNSLPFYQIVDTRTGQVIANKTALPTSATRMRVFLLSRYFVIFYLINVAGSFHIRFIVIPTQQPNSPHAPVDVSSQAKNDTDYFDGITSNNRIYIAFNASDGGGAIRGFTVNSNLLVSAVTVIAAATVGNIIAVTSDSTAATTMPWVLAWDAGTSNMHAMAYDQNYLTVLGPTLVGNAAVVNLTILAKNGTATFLYEVQNVYPTTAIRSDFIRRNTVTQAGVVGASTVMIRSVALASKAFEYAGTDYVLVVYGSDIEPTYYLIDFSGNIIMRLAGSNAGGYPNAPLASVSINDTQIYTSYLIKDFLTAVSKATGLTNSTPIYTQTGINIAQFNINVGQHQVTEIANSLIMTGGLIWDYDGYAPVELGFHEFPEDIIATPSVSGGGAVGPQQYFYQVTYEWTDATGNLHRSAPSIPVGSLVAGPNNSTVLQIPTLRLTAKTEVRIVIYRWSAGQQIYYQVTSITAPLLNDKTVDTVTYTDLQTDAGIVGNPILYTTGGVLENIAPPAASGATLFKNRFFMIDAEDRNLIWYSKIVLQGTPVEMTDLQTIYVAPSTISSSASGPITALSAMDDKLIIFKRNAIYYLTGNGPDITGANNDFSESTLVTSTVGCSNAQGIVSTPRGLMFQSDKGIWLLGRDLSTQYIGAPVEAYNDLVVKSGLSVPGTNQVRFTLDNSLVLMYDYYYDQWGVFKGVPGISSTLYQNLHTFLNIRGQVLQESANLYVDGSLPVLMQFTTAWFKLTNLQGFQRAYFCYLLGTYITPHKLNVGISYDYTSLPSQTIMISPTNFNPTYGSDPLYGDSSPYGGEIPLEQWRLFFDKQKCQAVQLSVQEVYDATFGVAPGAGLTISGLNFVIGAKKAYPALPSGQSAS